ncbi:MAG: hypothetical protein ACR2NH_12500 [Solirubrobacteraceae bacterium]
MSGASLTTAILGTAMLWLVSAALALALAGLLAWGSTAPSRPVALGARAAVNVFRGIPTSLYVIAAGLLALRLPGGAPPALFPGTDRSFQIVALAICVALALGSAGHLAAIFLAARRALGRPRIEAIRVLGLGAPARARVVAREAAPVALAPTGSRMVHHLHNTAFAGLFPVVEVYGHVDAEANATFRVGDAVLTGCLVYIALSAVVWLGFRLAEQALTPAVSGPEPPRPWFSTS